MAEVIDAFPTLVLKDSNVSLAQNILPFARQYLDWYDSLLTKKEFADVTYNAGITKDHPYTWGYRNTHKLFNTNLGFQFQPDSKEFIDYLKSKAIEFFEYLGYECNVSKLQINSFVSEMNIGDSHNIHSHPGSDISGVFYLNIPEKSASLGIADPRSHYYALPPLVKFKKNKTTKYKENILVLPPQQGDILMWEGWVPHSVSKNLSKGRVTIVFNIKVM